MAILFRLVYPENGMHRVMVTTIVVLLNAVSVYGAACRTDCAKAFTHTSAPAQTTQAGAQPDCHGHSQPNGEPDSTGSSDCHRELCSSSFTIQEHQKSSLWKAMESVPFVLLAPIISVVTTTAPAFETNSDPSEHQTDPPALSFTATTVITC